MSASRSGLFDILQLLVAPQRDDHKAEPGKYWAAALTDLFKTWGREFILGSEIRRSP